MNESGWEAVRVLYTIADLLEDMFDILTRPKAELPPAPKPRKTSEVVDSPKMAADITAVLEHLINKTGRGFNLKAEGSRKLVRARLNEGRTVDQCMAVIDHKFSMWADDEKMREYLRPSTLFNKQKFEEYLSAVGGGERFCRPAPLYRKDGDKGGESR